MDPQLCIMQQQGGMPRLWRPWWQLLPVTVMSRTPMATQHCILLLPKVRLLSITIITMIILVIIIIIIITNFFATVMQRTLMPHAALYLAAFRSQNAAFCDSDFQNSNANTALHLAASRGQATGSCVVQNSYTYTALHVAPFQDQALLHVSSCSLLCCAVQNSTVTQHCICPKGRLLHLSALKWALLAALATVPVLTLQAAPLFSLSTAHLLILCLLSRPLLAYQIAD